MGLADGLRGMQLGRFYGEALLNTGAPPSDLYNVRVVTHIYMRVRMKYLEVCVP
jgi:hypothetical protein